MAIQFDKYWDAIQPAPHFESRKEAARIAWETNPDKPRTVLGPLSHHSRTVNETKSNQNIQMTAS